MVSNTSNIPQSAMGNRSGPKNTGALAKLEMFVKLLPDVLIWATVNVMDSRAGPY